MNVNLAMFYNAGCCMYQNSWKMKCPKSDGKRLKLIAFKNITQHLLNPIINITNSVNKSKREIKTH